MLPFNLPPTDPGNSAPTWDGMKFINSGNHVRVLEYSQNLEGWTDDLTALHEEAAGENHPIDLASRTDALNQIREAVSKSGQNANILEVGCSSGYLLSEINSIFSQQLVMGADVVKAPLEKIGKTLSGVPLFRFDLLKCPIPNDSIDVLVMINVLEHIQDDGLALSEAFRILKPGGSLIIEVPSGSYLFDSYDRDLSHFRRYESRRLQKKLTGTGFQIQRKSHLGFFLFPGFALVKLSSKLFMSKRNNVAGNKVKNTSKSTLISKITKFETKNFAKRSLPWGIRVLITASK